MRQLAYLTFNDLPGGIFTSQVVEVCAFLAKEHEVKVQLVCLISRRGFAENKAKILALNAGAIVIPMFPGIGNWLLNRFVLKRKLKAINPDVIVARGLFATMLARYSSQARVCFDARGAYKAEFSEYDVGSGKFSEAQIHAVEKDALYQSDFRIAVSHAMVKYWKKEYDYTSNVHVVIPCTLSAKHLEESIVKKRVNENVRIVFSGGNGKWQSLDRVSEMLVPYFSQNDKVEMIFLTNALPENFELKDKFPDRVSVQWLKEQEVHAVLATCDYGWIYRDHSVTNQVASPVKFAEYLASGLSVIISTELGDFTKFVEEHHCGVVVGNSVVSTLPVVAEEQKRRNRELAKTYFTKEHFIAEYRRVIACV